MNRTVTESPPKCPEYPRLHALLLGELSTNEEKFMGEHLGQCATCRASFEQATQALLPDGLLNADHQIDTELRRIAGELIEESEFAEQESESRLDFLTPSDREDSLGRLGDYEILGEIGRGGMGIVLKAFDTGLDRTDAVKVLAPQLSVSAAARRRFQREARAAAAISHDHVVTVHAVNEVNGIPFLVMEFVSGVSLQDRIDKDGPLDLLTILRIGMQAASGLAAAHAQGLVHRDIKPANILLANGVEQVTITDFGLARAIDDVGMTQTGYVTGTPQFMSPEQARGETVDHRSDLFSLGAVLYTMAVARPPFRANTTIAILRRICEDEPRWLCTVNPDIPDWLARITHKLLAKKPAERFQSAMELAELFERHLAHEQRPASNRRPAPVTRHHTRRTLGQMVDDLTRYLSSRVRGSRRLINTRMTAVYTAAVVFLLTAASVSPLAIEHVRPSGRIWHDVHEGCMGIPILSIPFLLATWITLGRHSWFRKSIALVLAAVATLAAVSSWQPMVIEDTASLMVLSVVPALVVLTPLRLLGFRIFIADRHGASAVAPTFGIRDLLVLIIVIGVIAAFLHAFPPRLEPIDEIPVLIAGQSMLALSALVISLAMWNKWTRFGTLVVVVVGLWGSATMVQAPQSLMIILGIQFVVLLSVFLGYRWIGCGLMQSAPRERQSVV